MARATVDTSRMIDPKGATLTDTIAELSSCISAGLASLHALECEQQQTEQRLIALKHEIAVAKERLQKDQKELNHIVDTHLNERA